MTVPALIIAPTTVRAFYTKFDKPKSPPPPNFDDYREYKVIDPADIKAKIVDILGSVLARCWLDKRLMTELEEDPHACLLEQGIVMPPDMHLIVVRKKGKNRPMLVLYENQKRICALQLSMMATR
jgi:hypothetical protein